MNIQLNFSAQNQLTVKQVGVENMVHHQLEDIILM